MVNAALTDFDGKFVDFLGSFEAYHFIAGERQSEKERNSEIEIASIKKAKMKCFT